MRFVPKIPHEQTLNMVQVDAMRLWGAASFFLVLAIGGLAAWSAVASFPVTASAAATLEPSQSSLVIKAPVDAEIDELKVVAGQSIEKGAVLFTLSRDSLEEKLERAKSILKLIREQMTLSRREIDALGSNTEAKKAIRAAGVREAAARLRRQASSLQAARRRLESIRSITSGKELIDAEIEVARQEGMVVEAREQVQQKKAELAMAGEEEKLDRASREKAIRQLEERQQQQQQAVQDIEASLKQVEQRSPISGRVVSVADLRAGSAVTKGTDILSVVESDEIIVRANFETSYRASLAPKQRGAFTFDDVTTSGHRAIVCTLTSVATKSVQSSSGAANMVQVECAPKDQRGDLRVGVNGRLTVTTQERTLLDAVKTSLSRLRLN